MIKKYKKKPVVIEAIQLTDETWEEVRDFCPEATFSHLIGEYDDPSNIKLMYVCAHIKTLEGEMIAQSFDYIIKGIKGEFYPCKPDIFEASYGEII